MSSALPFELPKCKNCTLDCTLEAPKCQNVTLEEKGIISREGGKRFGYWKVNI